MLLSELLKNIKTKEIVGSTDKEITSISQDSRDKTFEGGLYFAVQGTQIDGHDFINEVVQKGALAIICEVLPDNLDDNITYITVKDSRKTVGQIASDFYGNPSKDLIVLAVTGTNGKTSIVHYATQLLKQLGEEPLLLSTAGDFFKDEKIDIERKAPSSLETIELHRVMRTYLDQGANYVCIEATSHGLDQDRLAGLDVDVAIFTNLTRDHIDYHETMENYVLAKKKLFHTLKPEALAIINQDDVYASQMIVDSKAKTISYGQIPGEYNYIFEMKEVTAKGSTAVINGTDFTLPIIGTFNLYNFTAVYAMLHELNFSKKLNQELFNNLKSVPGRLQMINNERSVLALVDYAHTPDALKNVLQTLQVIPHHRIITVFGCAGDRDPGKRIPMAQIAEKYSDIVIATSDNPRSEDPDIILKEVVSGFSGDNTHCTGIVDREAAIKYAVDQSKGGDIILVAGKGDEDYQEVNNGKTYFDDREVLDKYLTANS